MSATKKPAPVKPVPVRLPPEMVARIDAVKNPLIPRERYVRYLIDKALAAEENKR